MQIEVALNDSDFIAGVTVARGVTIGTSAPPLAARLDALVAARAGEEFSPAIKEAVRNLLRRGGFKPAGRSKPASEYLAQAAREGRFPRINNLVDINNLLSLESGLPISLLDLGTVGEQARIRYGRAGERYIFNPAGQEIDLAGLICVCRASDDAALGNPIKDSMAGKLKESTRDVVGVIYGAAEVIDRQAMGELAKRFADLLREFGHAKEIESHVA